MSWAMAGDWFKKAAGAAADALETARDKAADAISEQQVSFVRGKVAGSTVLDDSGAVIVDAGHVIDDSVIDRAVAAGKLHLLTSTVVKAKTQDMREKAAEAYARTDSGQEKHALGSVDHYIEARRYVGRYAGVDVTDIRGEVLIPMGKQIDDSDVANAREASQLGALIYAAQQPLPEGFMQAKAAESAAEPQYKHTESATYHRPKPLPLVGLPEEDVI